MTKTTAKKATKPATPKPVERVWDVDADRLNTIADEIDTLNPGGSRRVMTAATMHLYDERVVLLAYWRAKGVPTSALAAAARCQPQQVSQLTTRDRVRLARRRLDAMGRSV